jgi:tetratricopeptide (TPR) repeat protein
VRVSLEPSEQFQARNAESDAEQRTVSPSIALPLNPEEKQPRRFGDYELLEEIARGGMGVVYKARQVSLNRTVAVKMILAGQLAGAPEVLRFRGEAEAAAHLNHPNIVAIHEIGQYDGQHYFSMDYVEGQNLAEFVGQKPLPPKQAAKYLKTIAEAIQYAHEGGILHRDLKPSNILIDQSGQPRITDFGLAKRMKGDSDLTISGQVLGSPNFMPPEQAAGKRGQVGPQSDIYALGAILYYLLTARPPFAGESMTETLQLVVTTEPASPRLLNPTVPRDLETICLKCLSKEPERRYKSAQELADEVDRFLKGEPVHARPVGATGKAWRWCRRNPVVASFAAATLLLLLAVAVGSPIAAFRINRERTQARKQALKSQQVATFLKEMLAGVGPAVARGRDTKLLREVLDQTAERVGKELTNQPEVEADLRATLGRVYSDLGDFTNALAMHQRALDIRKRVHNDEHPDVASSLNDFAEVLQLQGRLDEAEAIHRDALAMRRRLRGPSHTDVAQSLANLGWVLFFQGSYRSLRGETLKSDASYAEAEPMLREALAIQRKALGSENIEVARSLNWLSLVLPGRNKAAEAETLAHEGLNIYCKLYGSEHPAMGNLSDALGIALESQGKLAEAEAAYRQGMAVRQKCLGDKHPDLRYSFVHLGEVCLGQGRWPEAEAMYRQLMTRDGSQLVFGEVIVAGAVSGLAKALRAQGKLDEAASVLRGSAERGEVGVLNSVAWFLATSPDAGTRNPPDAVAYAEKAVAATGRTNAACLETLATSYAASGRFTDAVRVQREAIALLQDGESKRDFASRLRLFEADQPYLNDGALAARASYLLSQGKSPEAETLLRECLILREIQRPDDWRTFSTKSMLGGALLGQKKYSEAEGLLRSGYEGMKQREDTIPGVGKPNLKEALNRLVQLYQATDRPEQAAKWKKKLEEVEQPEK